MPTTKEVLDSLRPALAKLTVDEVVRAAEEAGYGPRVINEYDWPRISLYLGSSFVPHNIAIDANGQVGVVYVEKFVDKTKVRFEPRFVEPRTGTEYPDFEAHIEILEKLGYQATGEFEVGPTVTTSSAGAIPNVTLIIDCLSDDIKAFLQSAAENLAGDVGAQSGLGVRVDIDVTVTQPK